VTTSEHDTLAIVERNRAKNKAVADAARRQVIGAWIAIKPRRHLADDVHATALPPAAVGQRIKQ